MIGTLKVSLALLLLFGIWFSPLTRPSAIGISILMLGAVVMHLKVKDPIKKALPAASVLLLAIIVAAG